jgi:8-oxo-dGTP pyrophosphatase MutT (NUDIX family)
MSTEIHEFVGKGEDAPRPDLPYKERDAITAVVRDPKNGSYLGLRWKEIDWETFITGGIEDGQTAEEAARAEVLEETGYTNLHLVCELPRYDAKFFHGPKNVNRHAHFRCFLFETADETTKPLSADELAKHESVWLKAEELTNFRLPEGHRFLVDHIFTNKL